MKVTRFEAENVHGYLPLSVDFLPDLTFLTGLNGSGKTSALRLLMGLLTPNIDELSAISFTRVAAIVSDAGRPITIEARKHSDSLELTTTESTERLELDAAELELLTEHRRRDEQRTPVHVKVTAHPVFQAIAKMSTPMFLGLDRRFSFSGSLGETSDDLRRRELYLRRAWTEDPGARGIGATGLGDVNILVSATLHEIRATQEQLDDRLRNKILLEAFKYKPADITTGGAMPSRSDLDKYKKRQAAAEKAATGLRLPVAEVQKALTNFFERMTGVVNSLEETRAAADKSPKQRPKHTPKTRASTKDRHLLEWFVNKPQTDRILEHLTLMEDYNAERSKIHEPVERFVSLVNSFLNQTGKRVQLSERADLVVALHSESRLRPLWALSSGERQIVVMLAHLSLNKNLSGSGVFIIDEPELSLHVGWQERFCDAIIEANPNVQLIMATHSPAIILDKTDNCRSLS